MSLIIYADGNNPNLPEYEFYGGTVRLRFDQSKWAYFKVLTDGSLLRQDGVTGVCKIIDKSQVLMPWAVKRCMEKLKRLLIERQYCGVMGTEDDGGPIPLYDEVLDEIIKLAKKADKEEFEDAGEIGHIAHGWIERYIRAILDNDDERRLELLTKLPEDERAANACTAALVWMERHNVRWRSTERKCHSLKYSYAGTMDGLALVDSCNNLKCCPHEFKDRLSLIDWKTSNYLYLEYLLQTAAYQQAYQEETGEKIEDRWINRLDKVDAEFDPWHIEGDELFQDDFNSYLNALALYRSVHRTEDRLAILKTEKAEAKYEEARAILDAERAIKCQDADEYKGVRLKKGCNGKLVMCNACMIKYAGQHLEAAASLVSG